MYSKSWTSLAAALTASLMLFSSASAQRFFDGDTSNPGTWEDPLNWTDDLLPPSGRTLIAAGNDAPLPAGVPATAEVTLSTDQVIDELRVGTRGGSNGTLNVTSGTLTTNWIFAGIQGAEDAGGGASGTFNLSGSGVVDSFGNVQLFGADPGGSTAELNIQDNAVFNGNETWIGLNQGAEGTVNQSGGTVNIGPHDDPNARAELRIGGDSGGDGVYNISAGALNVFDQGIFVGKDDDGLGRMNISGSSATIRSTNLAVSGSWDFPSFPDLSSPSGSDKTSFGVLDFTADAGGVTPIVLSGDLFLGTDIAEPITDNAALVVDMSLAPAGDILLIDVGGTRTGVFANAPPQSIVPGSGGRYILYSGGDGNDVVLSTTIPEPTAAGLLILGSLGLLGRRRR